MNAKKLLWTALLALPIAAGMVYGQVLVGTDQQQPSAGYVCPLTGETLPCPACCPLNSGKK